MESNEFHQHDVVAARDKAKEIFVSLRTREEQKVEQWRGRLLQCSKELVLDKLPFDCQTVSLRTMCPELYADIPNPDLCHQQVAAANEMLQRVNEIIADINRGSIELLEEYNRLYNGGK